MENEWIEVNIPFGKQFRNIVEKWTKEQIVKYFDSFNDQKEACDALEMDSFTKRGLNIPGVLIETDKEEQFLLGHIDCKGGTCGCCADIHDDTIITRYKIVWQKEHSC